jgi:hypothetical protein
MFERYELENSTGVRDEDKISVLKKKFGALHGVSSMLNLFVLVAAVVHGWSLAASLAI